MSGIIFNAFYARFSSDYISVLIGFQFSEVSVAYVDFFCVLFAYRVYVQVVQ